MSLIWLRVAAVLYGLACIAVLPAALFDRPRWRRIAVPATVAAAFTHLVSLVETLVAAHHTLPVEAHETESAMGLLLAVAFLLVFLRYRTVATGIFLLPLSLLLTMVAAFRTAPELIRTQHSGWVFLHVVLLLAAYAALLASLGASLLYLVQERRLKHKQPAFRGLPPLETADQIALRALLFGLPCMTGGLLIGSALAEATVGPAFFLDPKVLLSFALWVAYIGMIYIRRHSGIRGRRAAYLSSFVLFVVLAVWAANQLSSVHRFALP